MLQSKIKFTNIPLILEVDWIHGFMFQNNWGWNKYIIKKHPEIKKVYKVMGEDGQVKFLKKYIVNFKK